MSAPTKKRKAVAFGSLSSSYQEIKRKKLATSVFATCFSSFNNSVADDFESLVYFPSFLPYLLQVLRSAITNVRHRDCVFSEPKKRKVAESMSNGHQTKRLKFSSSDDPNMLLPPPSSYSLDDSSAVIE